MKQESQKLHPENTDDASSNDGNGDDAAYYYYYYYYGDDANEGDDQVRSLSSLIVIVVERRCKLIPRGANNRGECRLFKRFISLTFSLGNLCSSDFAHECSLLNFSSCPSCPHTLSTLCLTNDPPFIRLGLFLLTHTRPHIYSNSVSRPHSISNTLPTHSRSHTRSTHQRTHVCSVITDDFPDNGTHLDSLCSSPNHSHPNVLSYSSSINPSWHPDRHSHLFPHRHAGHLGVGFPEILLELHGRPPSQDHSPHRSDLVRCHSLPPHSLLSTTQVESL
jgi:hypothetical protein